MKSSILFLLVLISFTISAQIELQSSYSIGGSSFDVLAGLIKTADGKVLIAGTSSSTDLSMSNNMGGSDIILIQSNTEGKVEWIKNYGGTEGESAKDFIQSKEGGYLLVGGTNSSDLQVTLNKGQSDVWIVKLNTIGGVEWQLTVGDTLWDDAKNVIQNKEGDYLVLSRTQKNEEDVDLLLTKVDQLGNLIWNREYGGSSVESPSAILETFDGYFIIGSSKSSDMDVSANNGLDDFWVLKIDFEGNKLWDKNYGDSGIELSTSSIILEDGNIVMIGRSYSLDFNQYDGDCRVMKIDQSGILLWDRSYGGSNIENSTQVIETDGEELFVIGYSSSNDGDLITNYGHNDFWILQLDKDGNQLNSFSFGGSSLDRLEVVFNNDNRIYLGGSSYSSDYDLAQNNGFSDIWYGEIGFTTSTETISSGQNVNCFPNPANGILHVSIPQNESIVRFNLISINGHIIMSTNLNQLDVSGVAPGCYFANVKTNRGNYQEKVIVNYGM